ncbi:MAG: protein-L-isoaspartate(D-aspartate) O-methyltransferase [SAR202 cluster bacterium]|nr:protein-L-isoaspartate(D-aspartate) O-methyltransferase [SAR202 cluster bacterium]
MAQQPTSEHNERLVGTRRRLFTHMRQELHDEKVVEAMECVPREEFVPEGMREGAYEDMPLPIGEGQTISQPFIVAMMVSALEVRAADVVLEVGTGSGYQAAILSLLAKRVVSVERLPDLAEAARERLRRLGYANVEVMRAGRELGWPAGAPYDAIIVAAAAPKLPRGLITQLDEGGRLVVPVGALDSQELMKVTKSVGEASYRTLGGCRFVPLIGEEAWSPEDAADRPEPPYV